MQQGRTEKNMPVANITIHKTIKQGNNTEVFAISLSLSVFKGIFRINFFS